MHHAVIVLVQLGECLAIAQLGRRDASLVRGSNECRG